MLQYPRGFNLTTYVAAPRNSTFRWEVPKSSENKITVLDQFSLSLGSSIDYRLNGYLLLCLQACPEQILFVTGTYRLHVSYRNQSETLTFDVLIDQPPVLEGKLPEVLYQFPGKSLNVSIPFAYFDSIVSF